MTPQELKSSILQLAMQGKLVEQRPEEGTAEELYQQIQAEKQRLIKAGKIKKDKPLPKTVEDEIPFDIPESWKWVRWGELSRSIQYGYNAPAQEHGRIKMVRISDIQDGKILWSKVPYCDIKENEIPTYQLGANDILFTRTGGTVGKSYLVKEVPEEAIYAGYLIRTQYSSLLCPDYMKHFMESQLYWNQLRSGTIATAQPNCNGQTLSKMILPLPPLAEQNRIVAKIEELLPYIDRYADSYKKLERVNTAFPEDMKKSVLQCAIQGKLVEQRPEEGTGEELYRQIQVEKQKLIKAGKIKKDKPLPEIAEDEIPFDIPESWVWVRLSDLCKSISDGDHQPPPQVSNGIPFLVISNVSSGTIDFSNTRYVSKEYFGALSADRIAEKGDILFTVTGSYGIPVKVDCDQAFCFQRHIALLKLLIDWDYLFFALKSPAIKLQCDAIATGTAQKTVGLKSLRSIILPLPPLAEQKRIVAKLEEILPLCERLK